MPLPLTILPHTIPCLRHCLWLRRPRQASFFFADLEALQPPSNRSDAGQSDEGEEGREHGQGGDHGHPDDQLEGVGTRWSRLALTLLTITKDMLLALGRHSQPAKENVAPADLIGMRDQDTITKVLEFTIALGLVPHITPGAVPPLADRLSQSPQVAKAVEDINGAARHSGDNGRDLVAVVDHLLACTCTQSGAQGGEGGGGRRGAT